MIAGSLALAEQAGSDDAKAGSLALDNRVALGRGESGRAAALGREILELWWTLGNKWKVARILDTVAASAERGSVPSPAVP